jgi:hypothetical protein
LSGISQRLEAGLFQGALSEPLISRRYLGDIVKRLNSAQYKERQLADLQLRSFGPAVLPFLDSLSPSSLSSEQRARIQRVRQDLSGASVDSVERTAQWLSDDEHVWFALLRHDDPQRRHLAAIRLTAMRSDSLEFDPYGEESYRNEQLAQLESRIIRR